MEKVCKRGDVEKKGTIPQDRMKKKSGEVSLL